MLKMCLLITSLFFSTNVFCQEQIALVMSTLNNPFFVALKQGAESAGKKLGYQLIVMDSQNNPGRELANVQDLLIRKNKIILINPTDSTAVGNSILLANNANIPVITLDRLSLQGNVASHVASDNEMGGQLAGEFIAKKLGENAKIIQLQGLAGTSAAREREAGFNKAVKQHNLVLLASQPADFERVKGLNVMQNLLQSHPEVQGVFAQNDEMALGAMRALQLANRNDVIVVGFDGTEAAIDAVKKHKMAATVAQLPEKIGEKAIELADLVLKGQAVPKIVPIKLQLISQ